MSFRLTGLTENEIKQFVCSLGIEPDKNFLYGNKKNSLTKKIIWDISSNPIWNVFTETEHIIVFDENSLFVKKAFSFMNVKSSVDSSKGTQKFSFDCLESVSLEANKEYIYFDFISNNKPYSFYFFNHKFNKMNYENIKERIISSN